MDYTECVYKIREIIELSLEEHEIDIPDEMDKVILIKVLASDITSFIFSNF